MKASLPLVAAHKDQQLCPSPPTPAPGSGYALYATNQGLAGGVSVFIPLAKDGDKRTRRHLGASEDDACYVRCSALFQVPYFFGVDRSTGACSWYVPAPPPRTLHTNVITLLIWHN